MLLFARPGLFASDAQLQAAMNAALAKIPEKEREEDRDGEDDAYEE